jgi:hypothetical protein
MDDARTARELRMHYNILFAQDYTPKVWLHNLSNSVHVSMLMHLQLQMTLDLNELTL